MGGDIERRRAERHSLADDRCSSMKLLLSSLLLASLCALSSWSVSSGTLHVKQSPDVSVQVGETVNITCCWTWWDNRVRVVWMKNETKPLEEVHKNPTKESHGKANNCSTLTLGNITEEHSGRYVCTVIVEVPSYIKNASNGTVVTVTPKKDGNKDPLHPPDTQLPVVIALAVVVPSLLVALVCFCAVKRKRARATRVIYEVPHVDSDVDKHSTSSSRGSTQWCQVPVYESFDYFEQTETKESA